MTDMKLAAGTGSSVVVDRCQISGSTNLQSIMFLGFLPPVNQMRPMGERPAEQPAYPAELLYCPDSYLVQLGLIVDKNILFAPDYPYTSGTTKILRDNFAALYAEAIGLIDLGPDDLVIDIGSNDGTLLSNFNEGHQVLGIEPTDMAQLANERGIRSVQRFMGTDAASEVVGEYGQAKIVTAANVFAHIEDVDDIVAGIMAMLAEDGVFISESHYLMSLLETVQYDTIYHEHLRYYSVHSLQYLLKKHGLEIFHVTKIPTHGGSIRVYAARPGQYEIQDSVAAILEEESADTFEEQLADFNKRVVQSKLDLYALLSDIKRDGGRIHGIGAPSRASTLINYVGLDADILDYVLEVPGSYKTQKYMPGTLIPCVEETVLFEEQPEYAMMLSWHIAEEIMPKLKAKGFKGDFIIPLPEPRIVKNADV
ncbi:MAG: class I SAM-dependent methyltransferase [Chloroflexota bacterium]